MNNNKTIPIVAKHLLFWLLNYLLITVVMDFDWNDSTTTSSRFSHAYTYGLFFNATLFYTQVFWFVPKMYIPRKRLQFYVLSVLVIIVISIIETYFDNLLFDIFNADPEELSVSFISNIIFHILYTIAGFYYIIILEYNKSEKIRQSLVEETYKTELKYLKAQLNPHFLFNGINSVYHLIGKNNTLAKDTLLQFSELLRYQLYESSTHILLEKELNYVSKYIKIEKTRRGSDIQLQYKVEFENPKIKIAPLLLIPFIENAFKHCSNHEDDLMNTISINLKETEGKLTLNIKNSFDDLNPKKAAGGIGLNNVKRRLAILYPDTHQLDIRRENAYFFVDLVMYI